MYILGINNTNKHTLQVRKQIQEKSGCNVKQLKFNYKSKLYSKAHTLFLLYYAMLHKCVFFKKIGEGWWSGLCGILEFKSQLHQKKKIRRIGR
jgi:hypothetical protein